METIRFIIGTDNELVLGFSGETNVTNVTFEGFTLSNEANTMYLIIDNPIGKMIALTDYTFTVTSAITETAFHTAGQLAEIAPDGEMVRKSGTFAVTVKDGLAVNLSNVLA